MAIQTVTARSSTHSAAHPALLAWNAAPSAVPAATDFGEQDRDTRQGGDNRGSTHGGDEQHRQPGRFEQQPAACRANNSASDPSTTVTSTQSWVEP